MKFVFIVFLMFARLSVPRPTHLFVGSTFFNRQGYRAVHANQPLVALKHFAAAFNVSKSISHSFRNVFALGSLAASSGDLAKAAQFFGAAINCDERQAIAHFALGSVHFLQENYREALACYDRAIELNGDIKEFFHNRALVRRRLGM
jgi:tetratricopeptide (TPR) repeat protein